MQVPESGLRLFAEDVPGFYRNFFSKRCVELSTGQFALLTRFIDTGSVQEVWRCATLVILHISISDCTTRPQHQTCNLATCSASISDDQDDARGPPASNTVNEIVKHNESRSSKVR